MPTCLKVRLRADQLTDDVTKGTSTAEQDFYVEYDGVVSCDVAFSASDGVLTVPQPGGAYSASRPFCVLTSRESDRSTGTQFVLKYKFADPTMGIFPADLLTLPAVIDEGDQTWNEEYVIDNDSTPKQVKNTAGEPFDRGPERLEGDTTYTVTKYVTAATRNAIRADKRTNNPAAITLNGMEGDENYFFLENCRFTGVGTIFKAVLTIVHRKRDGGWVDKICSYGLRELDIDNKSVPIYEDKPGPDGKPVLIPKPWPLTEEGKASAFADDDAFVMSFYPYPDGTWGWFVAVTN